ncbi:hypothetical protein [Vulgatibacter sp.]|uniref:hypothetical protein n=1 Tax=Vulgatibacter sp. TaxID=1971226 RepID=UPI0035686461
MRSLVLPALLLAAACASGGNQSAPSTQQGGTAAGQQDLADARTEVAAITAAARDAAAALAADEAAWDEARQVIVTPFDRNLVEGRLAAHAQTHRLELSQFQLLPMRMAQLDVPDRFHPSSPYPVRQQDAILEAPIRFALTPLQPQRIEAFLRTLPEVEPLVIVQVVERGMDFIEVEAAAPTFRPFDETPRYALEVPPPEQLDGAGYEALVREVEQANEALAALSEARLRRVRLEAFEAAKEKAARHAASIELPQPAEAGAPAPRTTVE